LADQLRDLLDGAWQNVEPAEWDKMKKGKEAITTDLSDLF